ncbi:MAG TPA: hypothetical protein DC047_11580 [Blastocatellia bacterium]|nr:hypothetical protein [Blastocatellia bacterium]
MLRVLLSTIIGGITLLNAPDQQASLKPEAEEYAVYSVLVNDLSVRERAQLVLIIDHTDNPSIAGLVSPDSALPELIQSYLLKAASPVRLEKEFKLASKYQLISEQESASMSSGPPTVTLSRVGFNSRRDKALVYFACRKSETFKREQFVIMIKGPEGWKVGRSVVRFLQSASNNRLQPTAR